MFEDSCKAGFENDVVAAANAKASAGNKPAVDEKAGKGFVVTLEGHTPLSPDKANECLLAVLAKSRADNEKIAGGLIKVVATDYSFKAVAAPAGGVGPAVGPAAGGLVGSGTTAVAVPDPLFPEEEAAKDTAFTIIWYVRVNPDAVKVPTAPTKGGAN
jgi:hypothetical protein